MLGSGGREHALAWKLAQDADVFCAPGNPGIAQICSCFKVNLSSIEDVLRISGEIQPDLVVIGPEDPLIAGLADGLRSAGLAVFGPGKDAARLEGSKAFSKSLMAEVGVPTAQHETVQELEPALTYIAARFAAGRQVAVKASGAALGKGVVVCDNEDQAREAARMMLADRALGDAGATVVVEDRLVGREFSLLTIVSGRNLLSLPVAQDYKRIGDGDTGPNTGGMGSVSPVPWLDPALVQQAEDEVARPIINALADRGVDYRGVLFSGLLVQDGQPFCLEYNVRFGDPETQSVLRRLGSGFADALLAAARGEPISSIETLGHAAVSVVVASEGYPGSYEKGRPIQIDELPEGVVAFHAGTALQDGQLVTAGGRVAALSAVGKDVESARSAAYEAVHRFRFPGKTFRTDIGR